MLAVQGKNYLSQFQWLSSVRCSGRVAVVRQHLRELSGFWSLYIHNPSGGHRCRVRDSWGRPSLTSHHHIGFSSWGSVCYAWLLFCIPLNYLFWATLCLRPSIPKIQTFAKTPNPKMGVKKKLKICTKTLGFWTTAQPHQQHPHLLKGRMSESYTRPDTLKRIISRAAES